MSSDGISMEAVAAARGFELIERSVHVPPLTKPPCSDAEPCFCSPSADEVDACHTTECINYATYVECPLDRCATGNQCRNQRLQRPEEFPRLEPFLTEMKGYGVRTCDPVPALSPVGEYVGEIIDQRELYRRTSALGRHESNFYYIQLTPGVYIDARNRGGFTRFVNHSCNPNCKAEKWTVGGETRLLVFALRDLAPGIEITFDYQWTVLGRQRIKCFCGEETCKGFIGDEVEGKTLEAPQGIFKDPEDDDGVKDQLVGRKLRLFQSHSENAAFSVVRVTRYNPDTDEHTVADDTDDAMVSGNADADDDADLKEAVNIRVVQLASLKWQLYVDLKGLSTEEVQKHVFSIPKLQRPHRDSAASSPQSSSSRPATPQPPLDIMASKPLPPPPTTTTTTTSFRLLLKGFPTACDEAFFRRMLGTRATTLVHVDVFFLDTPLFGYVGWGLLEFSDAKVFEVMRARFDNKPFLNNTVRSFVATDDGIATFLRTKRTRRISDYASRQTHRVMDAPRPPRPSAPRSPSPPPAPDVYCYGRKLNWVTTSDHDEPTPSQKSGMSATVEATLLTKCYKIMMNVVKRLKFEREDASTAVVLFYRYVSVHPMNVSNIEWMAATCLHVVLKSHSRKHEWHDFLQAVYAAKYQTSQALPTLKELATVERYLLSLEGQLLESLRFDISSTDPFSMFDACFKGGNHDERAHKLGKYLISDCLGTSVWTRFHVECIVVAVLYVATASATVATLAPPPPPYLPRIPRSNRKTLDAVLDHLLDVFCAKSEFLDKRGAIVHRIHQLLDATDATDAPAIQLLESKWYSASRAIHAKTKQLLTTDVENITAVRRRAFLGRVHASVPYDLAGRQVYLQPWPYRESSSANKRGMSEACLRELSTLMNLHARDAKLFVEMIGIVFPHKEFQQPNGVDDAMDIHIDIFPDTTKPAKKPSAVGLEDHRYYLAFERPLHMLSSLLETRAEMSFPMRKRIVHDLFRAVALCHEHNIVHRFISPSNLFVFARHVKLGGFYSARHVETKGALSGGYTLSENEHGEHCTGAALHTTAPEILLGEKLYTKRSDLWSLGVVALNILLLGPPLIVGKEVPKQLEYLYRICGSPREDLWPEAMELPNFHPPKRNYQVRLRKVILERMSEFPEDAIDLFENVLALDPKRRWHARRALQSPWFADVAGDDVLDFARFPATIEDRLDAQKHHSHKRKSEDKTERRRHHHHRKLK
ncbi:Aste57867_20880 [Aphanomyces stellatus]|uniref:Aste57867_20880 protein n=1 Tax=Aphanomyces stellatus TaxID=120398 RepID=A0A485LGP0_9STRA|nr:hypothetical protein As57867_020812 [Aphanomyces stellatus]VFT97557.1 Aste57867_20880 [Aphanomyces stellatus]